MKKDVPVEEKELKKDKEKKNKNSKKSTSKKEKKNILQVIASFFAGVKKEIMRVHYPSKKEMVKYSVATIVFVFFFALFFYLVDVIFAFIRAMV